MIDRWLDWAVAYIELGLGYVISYLTTIEGMIAVVFGIFFLGLLSRIKSV